TADRRSGGGGTAAAGGASLLDHGDAVAPRDDGRTGTGDALLVPPSPPAVRTSPTGPGAGLGRGADPGGPVTGGLASNAAAPATTESDDDVGDGAAAGPVSSDDRGAAFRSGPGDLVPHDARSRTAISHAPRDGRCTAPPPFGDG